MGRRWAPELRATIPYVPSFLPLPFHVIFSAIPIHIHTYSSILYSYCLLQLFWHTYSHKIITDSLSGPRVPVLVRHGASWCVLVRFGTSWFVLVRLDPSWWVLVRLGVSWFRLGPPWCLSPSLCIFVSLGASWWVLVRLGACWPVLVHLGESKSVLVNLGPYWCVLVRLGASWYVLPSFPRPHRLGTTAGAKSVFSALCKSFITCL